MPQNDGMANIVPERIGADSRFKFKCHKDVKCFTKCCRGINIILTPYDIIRMKNRLGASYTRTGPPRVAITCWVLRH